MADAEELPFWRRVWAWVHQHPWWIALGVLYVLVWWLVPPLLYRYTGTDKAAKLKAITDTRTALLAGVIGVGALLTFWLNSKVHRTTVQTLELTERGQITERFNKAIDHLGSDKLDLRLGGIYALERIAKDSDDDCETIAEVLCAFVRHRSPWPPSQPEPGRSRADQPSGEQPTLLQLRVRAGDVQAVLTVLGRGSFPRHPGLRLALGRVDLRRAILDGADLHGASFFKANLERANLQGANLQGAYLHGANLQGARLIGADLERANLNGADLESANLGDADLRLAEVRGANLRHAYLRDVKLQGADLAGTFLQDAVLLRAHLEGADLTDTHLGGTVAEGAVDDEHTKWPDGFKQASIGVEVRE